MATVLTRDVIADMLKDKIEEEGGSISGTAAREEVRWFFDTVAEALLGGDEVRIHGFGAFKTVQRPARLGRNPRTGEAVKVAARRVVRFAPSTTLTAALKTSKSGGAAAKKTSPQSAAKAKAKGGKTPISKKKTAKAS